jgi:mevalonate kinase
MKKQVVAKAPGKLIISGEYSVLVGMPAIAFAIDDFTETTAIITDEPFFEIELKDYNFRITLSPEDIDLRYSRTQSRYNDFLSGLLPIAKVLDGPVDLCCFIIKSAVGIERFGLKVSVGSTIPISSGFGSSAAFIVSLLKALDALLCMNLTSEKFYQLALDAENLVHGRSSGIDIMTSIGGGCNYFSDGQFQIQSSSFEFFSIFTGKPEVSTGVSIAKVKKEIAGRKHLFKEVTLNIKAALESQDLSSMMRHIRANNLLLNELGVVPGKVQKFIEEIEAISGAAKICGSGAVSGENAGAVLAFGDFHGINEIAKRYNYNVKKIRPEARGAYVL